MLNYRFAGLGVVFATLINSAPAIASFDDQFVCNAVGDGHHIVVISSADPSNASVQFSLGEDHQPRPDGFKGHVIPMQQVISGSGVKYAGLGHIFHAKGAYGVLDMASVSVSCTLASEEVDGQTDREAEENALNIPARSYGGKVRAGPGMEFTQIASLREGDPVTLLTNTGETMNGYDWFMILMANGEIGYQWGGLLCSDALHPPGIFGGRNEACPVR